MSAALGLPGGLPEPVEIALANLDRAYDVKSWHGTNLEGSIRAVPVEVAVWRPGGVDSARHNVWEYRENGGCGPSTFSGGRHES